MLRRAGYDDVTVFERDERIGGVWHYNAYPGCACDVPSHLDEFSFAPSPPVASRDVLRVGLGLGLRRVAA